MAGLIIRDVAGGENRKLNRDPVIRDDGILLGAVEKDNADAEKQEKSDAGYNGIVSFFASALIKL